MKIASNPTDLKYYHFNTEPHFKCHMWLMATVVDSANLEQNLAESKCLMNVKCHCYNMCTQAYTYSYYLYSPVPVPQATWVVLQCPLVSG